MIPQKIQIKNFLSYGPNLQTIDFTHYSLICLSGKNGHGKSALLDAMTWALWGQARKTSGNAKADQGLLRLGQTQMLVIFDFMFGGKAYRIRREYMETYGKPVSVLEFGMVEPETEVFIPLTDKTVRLTQDKIEQTLRLDFESFANSAFLRQGNSNEFSKKSPKDRKHILATILGLDQYEVIRKLALEKTREATTQKTVLNALQEKRLQELATQETLNLQLQELNEQNNMLTQEEKELEHQKTVFLTQKNIFDEKAQQSHTIAFQIEQINQLSTQQKLQLKDLLLQWRSVNKTKKTLYTIQQLEQEKHTIINAIAAHQKLLQENLSNKEKLLTITQEINTIEQIHTNELLQKKHAAQLGLEKIIFEQSTIQKSYDEQVHTQLTLKKEQELNAQQIADYQQEIAKTTIAPEFIIKQESKLEKKKAQYQHFIALGNLLTHELSLTANKKKMVQHDNPSCPLCEQNLSASRKKFLKVGFENQESLITHRLERLKRIIPIIKTNLIADHTQLQLNKEIINKQQSLQAKIKELAETQLMIVERYTAFSHTIEETKTILAEYHERIKAQQQELLKYTHTVPIITNPNYNDLIVQKKLLEQHIQKNIFHEELYKEDQKKVESIEKRIAEYQTLQKDITLQENRKKTIQELCISLKQLKKNLKFLEEKRSQLGDLVQQSYQLKEEQQQLKSQEDLLKHKKESLMHVQGQIENQQQRLTTIHKEYAEEQIKITHLETIIDDYQTIATATGKDGIQALLIEDAIPEIEQEANYLLSRLTNNQAHIFIESLRDLKKGGTKETLDIKISDQAGIRPYELFSGGEAFRIDFALRIAISKLLARRSGTALQTLIIDEGFGSQDDEGLSNIMDAIHKIQDDFSKIIIVSHLPAMKDQFPVQFVIEKGVQGSTVKIIEQG